MVLRIKMTDEKFIEEFILKKWSLCGVEYSYDGPLPKFNSGLVKFETTEGEILVKSEITGKSNLIKDIVETYDNWTVDETGKTVKDYINDWLEKELITMKNKVMDSFKHFKVKLGLTGWDIYDGDKLIDMKTLQFETLSVYDRETVRIFFNEWYEQVIIEESEKIMNSEWS